MGLVVVGSHNMVYSKDSVADRQNLIDGMTLAYGQSVTDACLGWDDSELLIRDLAKETRDPK